MRRIDEPWHNPGCQTRILQVLGAVALSVLLGFCSSTTTGGGGGGSFHWYGSNPPVANHRCEYLGLDTAGVQVWECRPL